MAQVKIVFYLPRRDNDGRSLQSEIQFVELELYSRFGGLTMKGVIRGMFRMPDGSLSRDVLNCYELVTDDWRVSEVESVLLDFKSKTTQASIYCEIQHDTDVRFL